MKYLLILVLFINQSFAMDKQQFINHIYQLQRTINFKSHYIPPSLIIAQAIDESNWGRSRFAIIGHNLFGQHCHIPGCKYMYPLKHSKNSVKIAVFASDTDAVRFYLNNLNTSNNYKHLREIRAWMIKKHLKLSGFALADGLDKYSANPNYIKDIKKIILKYNLKRYDNY